MATAMRDLDQFETIAGRRRAVRAFLPRPVDRALIERAITIAATAPSSCNTQPWTLHIASGTALVRLRRSEEHTYELQSLMRHSYAVFCLKKKKHTKSSNHTQ